jgi:anti-anti-sigma factor
MGTSSLRRWLAPPARCGTPAEQTPAVAPARVAPHAPRPSAAGPAVQVSVVQTAADVVIRVKGEATVQSVGVLQAGLLAPSACRPAVVTLDLSELRSLSCLAMGVLVAYRRGVVRTGGRVRLAEELQPAVHEALARAELFGLFEAAADAGPASGLQAIA